MLFISRQMRSLLRLGFGFGKRKQEPREPPDVPVVSKKYVLLVRNKKATFVKLSEDQIRDAAAIKIQAVVRQHLARYLVLQRIDSILLLLKGRCARIIQRLVRRIQSRRKSREKHFQQTKIKLQITIVQSFVRVWLAKRKVSMLRNERVKDVARLKCAIFLQCCGRRLIACRIKEFRKFEKEKRAEYILKVVMVQTCFRRHLAREVLITLKREKRYLDSVRIVQRATRRYLAELESHKIEVIRRVTLAQCLIRQFLAKCKRQQLVYTRKIVLTQSIARR